MKSLSDLQKAYSLFVNIWENCPEYGMATTQAFLADALIEFRVALESLKKEINNESPK